MIYGIYKNARNAAWQCLLDYNITELPVKILRITQAARIKVLKNSKADLLFPNECGRSFIDNEQWYIIYKDIDSKQRCRFTLAHELGHIFLGHKLTNGYNMRTFVTSKPIKEQEADIFASRLLSPACVLWGLNLHSPDEISKICNISLTAASIRAKRMKVLYKRNKFLTSPLERAVYMNFEKFIYDTKKELK